MAQETETAVFGGGCFWCTEAVFQELRGVLSVLPGYAGGSTRSSTEAHSKSSPQAAPPTYEQVCSGKTGHAEVIKIEYNPEEISYKALLTVFFATHDPSTPNRQGNDIGPQYRSIILYTIEKQKEEAEQFIKQLNESTPEGKPIVTELKPLDIFYEAEAYHREYYKKNSSQPYCQIVINPKLEKLQKEFAALLKTHTKNQKMPEQNQPSKSDKNLPPELYRIAREKGTEAPFSGKYVHTKEKGMYHCAVCGAELFSSDTKFDSGTGWPSFTEPANLENIELKEDTDHGMRRTEVACKKCGAHLGHVFDDGPQEKGGKRYCINSVCLDLKKEEEPED